MFLRFFAALYRLLLSLRYRVTVRGADVLEGDGPILLLSNHQALVDPQILVSQVYRYRPLSPVMSEKFFHAPVISMIARAMSAIPVPDVLSAEQATSGGDVLFKTVLEALRQGTSVLLYPAGQLAGQGKEAIFGKQTAYVVVKHLPPTEGARVVVATIHGLWGSMWSRAWIGKTPNFAVTALKAIGLILANLVLFAPRRRVSIEFEDVTADARRWIDGGMQAFNEGLESVFNRDGEEPVSFIRHVFYAPPSRRQLPPMILGSIADYRSVRAVDASAIDHAVLAFAAARIAAMKELDASSITPASNLILDLHFDSLQLAEIVTVLRAQFPAAGNPPLSSLKTVADLCLMAQGLSAEEAPLKPCTFDAFSLASAPLSIDPDQGLLAQMIETLAAHPHEPFCYDALLGSTTRRAFLTRAFVLAEMLKRAVPRQHVGIMLPAIQGAPLLILAAYIAGKIPVMLNWTMGDKAMRHCMETVGIQKIVTARAFFSIVKDQIPVELQDRFVFLEDAVKSLPLLAKVLGAVRARMPRWSARGCDDAVILFTSGSEALPKAVPLTQKNLLADIAGTLELFPLQNDHRVLAFLPPFHSFGFTITCILPLLTGLRVAYTPNPSDARAILAILAQTKATILPSTPTFLKLLLAASKTDDLRTLRIAITGAEACPEEVRTQFAAKTSTDARIIEGYGITECSPVVTINPLDHPKKGSVGRFIPGVSFRITPIDSLEPLPAGQQGMIYVRGASIFRGYLDIGLASPFTEIEGQAFYKTGDLGYVDDEGYLFITGRLKRFIKIGGEMISLPFIETILLQKYGDPQETVIAIEGSDQRDPPIVILFSTKDIDVREANAWLRSNGVANIVKIDEVRRVDVIPVLGTGKVDYKVLKQQI